MDDNTQKSDKQKRRTFSVSRDFEYILPLLDDTPNMSRFICQAIAEKLDEKDKETDTQLSIDKLKEFFKYASMLGLTIEQAQHIALNADLPDGDMLAEQKSEITPPSVTPEQHRVSDDKVNNQAEDVDENKPTTESKHEPLHHTPPTQQDVSTQASPPKDDTLDKQGFTDAPPSPDDLSREEQKARFKNRFMK